MAGLHVAALGGLVWSAMHPPVWPSVALGFIWYWCSGLSITGGYHRLFAHRTYKCSRPVMLFYLLFGAAALQNSAVAWASDHRKHHAHTDEDGDPYDARRGFWWSHVGWLLRFEPQIDYSNVWDLADNPLVAWQHEAYPFVATTMAAIVPMLIAAAWRDPFGGLLWAGCFRLVAQYHSTFAINSVAHRFGRRPYSTATSARDNILVALVTMGEGYHNFHHSFPSDYRNGVRWFDYDPTKWLVRALETLGLATDLKRASDVSIERARLRGSHSA